MKLSAKTTNYSTGFVKNLYTSVTV